MACLENESIELPTETDYCCYDCKRITKFKLEKKYFENKIRNTNQLTSYGLYSCSKCGKKEKIAFWRAAKLITTQIFDNKKIYTCFAGFFYLSSKRRFFVDIVLLLIQYCCGGRIELRIFGFFKDDHNRIIRIIVFPDTREMAVHVLHVLLNGEKAWVPFEGFNLASSKKPIFTDVIEKPALFKKLTEKAKDCSLFNKEE